MSSYIDQIVAGQPRKPSPIHDALQAIQNWASAGLVDGDISASAAIAISKTALGTYTAPVAWAPTFTAASGTPTTVTINKARWTQIGKTAVARLDCTLTTIGTATGALYFTLPVNALDRSFAGGGTEIASTGQALAVYGQSTTLCAVQSYTGGSIWANGYQLIVTVVFEPA